MRKTRKSISDSNIKRLSIFLEELKKKKENGNISSCYYKSWWGKQRDSQRSFSIYWIMKQNGIENPEDKAIEVSKVMDEYKHWKTSKLHEAEMRKAPN